MLFWDSRVSSSQTRVPSFICYFIMVCLTSFKSANTLELILLHNNNFKGRFEEITKDAGYCSERSKRANECLAGFARFSTVIKQFRHLSETRPQSAAIYLNAGGIFSGSIWFAIHGGDISFNMMNLLNPDAMALGFREFASRFEDLSVFVNGSTFKLVSANTDVSNVPELSKVLKSVMLETNNGLKIGVVGHVYPNIHEIYIIDKRLQFTAEIAAIRREASSLRRQGADLIISLGHSYFNIHKEIAKTVDDVDIVVGSMRDTMLYNGRPPGGDVRVDGYPVIVKRKGKKIPVVSTVGMKYLGCLNITLNSRKKIVSFKGQPIYMKASIAQDEEVLDVLEKYAAKVREAKTKVIGQAMAKLHGGREAWHLKECNFGNLIADAYVAYLANQYTGPTWTDTPIALIDSGLIARGLDLPARSGLTMAHIIEAFPLEIMAASFEIKGKHLRYILEVSVSEIEGQGGREFLQVSGIRVHYDLSKAVGKRVDSVRVRCGICEVPNFDPLLDNGTYRIVTTNMVALGKLGYTKVPANARNSRLIDECSSQILIDYIMDMKIILAVEEDRIMIANRRSASSSLTSNCLTSFCVILFILF